MISLFLVLSKRIKKWLGLLTDWSSACQPETSILLPLTLKLSKGKDKNAGYLDQFRIDNKSNKVVVSGWNANDQSTVLTNHYLILFDKTANHEVARQA